MHRPHTLSFPRIFKGPQCPPLGFGCAAGEALSTLAASRLSLGRSPRASSRRRPRLASRVRGPDAGTPVTCVGMCGWAGRCVPGNVQHTWRWVCHPTAKGTKDVGGVRVVNSSAHRTEVGGQTKHGQKGLWPLTKQPSLRVYDTRGPSFSSHGAK